MRGKELISLLQKNGWTLIRIKGSHHIMKKGKQIEVIPVHDKELPKGLLERIIRRTGIKLERRA